ncbi:MAG: hypothetical protein ACTHNW_03545 [Mucilaginibacter sp.]
MTIKIAYISIFAIIDFFIWMLLNRPGIFSKKVQYFLGVAFALFVILHAGLIISEYLLPWKVFFNLFVVTCAPVLIYAWYIGVMAWRKIRNKPETKFDTGAIRFANIFFSYVINIAALVIQVLMILGYYPDRL